MEDGLMKEKMQPYCHGGIEESLSHLYCTYWLWYRPFVLKIWESFWQQRELSEDPV
jgi:hypothetical protein